MGVALGLIFLLVLVMILRILLERLLTRRFKQTFDDPDPTVAIRNMFTYTAAVMTAYGVPRKASPYQREEILAAGISQECAQAYREVVDIRQEAVYSTHLMTEDQRERVRRFKDRLVREVWQKSSFAERLMYRFRYFL